jgi:hypothetical protein
MLLLIVCLRKINIIIIIIIIVIIIITENTTQDETPSLALIPERYRIDHLWRSSFNYIYLYVF